MSSPVQLTGGAFQDAEGNLLANGYLKMRLSQDGNVGGVNICSGIEITIQLDSNANAVTSPAQSVWGNDAISPVNTFYRVTGYTAQGQPAWGPNNQQVTGTGTFNLGAWTPNSVISWTPPPMQVVLKTNGTLNSTQTLLNIVAGTNVSISEVAGSVTFSASGLGLTLETNGTPNSSQTLLNLHSGTGIGLSESGGTVTISSTGGGGGVLGLWPGNWLGMNISASQDGSAMTDVGFGMQPTQISGYPVVIIPATASHPRGAKIQSSSLNLADGICDRSSQLTLAGTRDWFMKAAIDGVVDSRYWWGFSDVTPSNAESIMNSDTPAANFVGFRWNSTTDGSNFQAICQTDATHQTKVDTGVAVVADAYHLFEVVPTVGGTVITFYIDGVLVATISTNLPTVQMGTLFTVDGLNTNLTTFNFIFCYAYALVTA